MKKASGIRLTLHRNGKTFPGLPFVFACWTANKPIENDFIEEFNSVLGSGVNNIDKVVEKMGQYGDHPGRSPSHISFRKH